MKNMIAATVTMSGPVSRWSHPAIHVPSNVAVTAKAIVIHNIEFKFRARPLAVAAGMMIKAPISNTPE